jgi:uncharacterized protein (DUF2249 family)
LDHLPKPIRKNVETQKYTTLLDHLPNPIRKNVEKQKNTTLLDHHPNPIRKPVETQKIPLYFCVSTFFLIGLGR